MKYKFIHNDLVKSVIVPVLFACLALAICFSLLLEHFHKKDIDSQIQLAHQFLIVNQQSNLQKPHLENLKHASHAILAMPIFKNIYFFNQAGDVVTHAGLPENIDTRLLFDKLIAQPKKIVNFNSIKFASLELPDTYLVAIGLNKSIFDINRYQGIVIIICVFFACILILQFFMRSFNRALFYSIRTIERGISDLIAFNYEKKIPPSNVDSFKPLTNMVNKLSDIQRKISEQALSDIEQSTSDLRETLETVEMQNIELDIARKEATNASRVKSQFLANTSHEIRTPLNGILGFSQLLKKTQLDDQQEEYLSTIETSAKGLLTIINDILDFSRLDIGSLTLDYKPIKLRELINETLKLHSHTADEKHLCLLTFVEHDVPEELLGDPLRLKQILSNLVSNAIKFTDSGNILISVSKDNSIKNHFSLRFEVKDQGVGLSSDQMRQTFDPFSQIDASESRLNGGIGLGLAIAKRLTEKMHGQIGVESEINQGSTFWFTVALGRNLNINHSQYFLYDTLRNVHAVVYDSCEQSRQEMTHYLDGWGAESTTVASMDDIIPKCIALQILNPPTLILLDCYCEQYEFNQLKLRKTISDINKKYDIPVFVLASKSLQRILEVTLSQQKYIFIDRPLLSNKLHEKICENLGIASEEDYQKKFDLLEEQNNPSKEIVILVVDDNPANLKLVTELLKGLNINVHSVESGNAAIESYLKQDFDLIFMDIQMPGMDGLEATQHIRKIEANKDDSIRIPIIALTAHAVSEQKQKLLFAGLDDALSKPVSENEIKHTIERWTGETIQSSNRFNQTRSISRAITNIKSPQTEKTKDKKDKIVDASLGLALANDNPSLAIDMLDMLVSSLDATYKQLCEAIETDNRSEIENIVHKLHGGCCYTGVPKLKDISFKIDKAFQDEALDNLEEDLEELKIQISLLQDWACNHDIQALYSDQ